jgi:hypothetical protein
VASCEECSREVQAQRAIAGQMRDESQPQTLSAQRSFGKLWTRIEASESAMPAAETVNAPAERRGPSRTVRWLAAAVVVQAVGLATLGLAAWNGGKDSYQTVTSEAATQAAMPAVRLVFDPAMSVGAMNEVLERHDLKIVAGPNGTGIFTAALTGEGSATPESVAKELSSDSRVQFAQPVAN